MGSENIFGLKISRIFQKKDCKVDWALHTTMTVDYVFAACLMLLQNQGEEAIADVDAACSRALAEMDVGKTAVFYDQSQRDHMTPPTMGANKASVSRHSKLLEEHLFPFANHTDDNKGSAKQILHAKLSLLRFTDGSYRLGVYSKNATFGSNTLIEVGSIFDLEFTFNPSDREEACGNGTELTAFLHHLYTCTAEKGREWLKNNELHRDGSEYKKIAKGFRLKKVDENIYGQLYFGGCGKGTLAQKMHFDALEPTESIIISPPGFIQQGDPVWKYFTDGSRSKLLWDAQEGYSSHAKIFLLSYNKSIKEGLNPALFLGSANCSRRGLGHPFGPGTVNLPNVEVMVKLSPDMDTLREQIKGVYAPFKLGKDKPSFVGQEDVVGTFLHQCTVTKVQYAGAARRHGLVREIVYTFQIPEKVKEIKDVPEGLRKDKFPFCPLEYGKTETKAEIKMKNREICIAYRGKNDSFRFKPSKQMLLVGSSGVCIQIPDSALNGVETYAVDALPEENYISKIMEETDVKGYCEGEISQLEANLCLREKLGHDTKENMRRIELLRQISQQLCQEETNDE